MILEKIKAQKDKVKTVSDSIEKLNKNISELNFNTSELDNVGKGYALSSINYDQIILSNNRRIKLQWLTIALLIAVLSWC